MECRQDIADPGEERILLACVGQGYRAEADFCAMSRKDLASKRLCKQLGSQANTKNGRPTTNCRGEQAALFGEKWIRVFFIGAERTAHYHQAIDVIRLGDLIFEIEASNLDVEAAAFCFTSDDARPLPLYMLQHNPSILHPCHCGTDSMRSLRPKSQRWKTRS
jgi:hypothetical protein